MSYVFMKTDAFFAHDTGDTFGMAHLYAPPAKARAVKTVICVDDGRLLLKLLETRLDQHDSAVVGAENVNSDLKAATRLKADVIVHDATMPGIDGFRELTGSRCCAASNPGPKPMTSRS